MSQFQLGQVVKLDPTKRGAIFSMVAPVLTESIEAARASGVEFNVLKLSSVVPDGDLKGGFVRVDLNGDQIWIEYEQFLSNDSLKGMSMAAGVAFTNATFGKNLLPLPTNEDEAVAYWRAIHSQAMLVQEELNEIFEAIEGRDLKMLRDGTSDVLVTALGIPHLVGFDVEADMTAVLESNISKVSQTASDAKSTVAYYAGIGVETYSELCPTVSGFIVKVKGDQYDKKGKFYPNNKFLKCVVGFKEPVFN